MLRFLIFLAFLAGPARAESPRVVTDIPPIHGLVSMVMGDVGTPDLVVGAGSSPHHHAMRPSEARMLAQADVVIWVGHQLTRWLEDPIENLAKDAVVLELMDVEGVQLLPYRDGAMFVSHDHGDHDGHEGEEGHDDHDDHDGEEGHDGHEDHDANKDHDGHDDHDTHDDHDGHDDDNDHDNHEGHDDHDDAHEDHDEAHNMDPHVWLGPENAILFLSKISALLSDIDPENAATYAQNAQAGQAAIKAAVEQIDSQLASVRSTPFIVLHDGFHYFEEHFEAEAIGSISAGDGQSPGAVRMKALRDALKDSGVSCAFTEPGMGRRLLDTATEGLDVKHGVLDPLGTEQELGADHYVNTLLAMGQNMADCLSQ